MSSLLTILNFSSQINQAQVEKGIAYFKQGAVEEVVELAEGRWQAEVSGTNLYDVQIRLDGDTISKTSCDCPHDDPFCKHVVAVLFAIQQKQGLLRPTEPEAIRSIEKKKSAKAPAFETVLKKAGEKELKEFVKSFAVRNKEFRTLFLLRFDLAEIGNNLEKFRRLIRQTAAAYTRGGFIDWANSTKALRGATDILDEAEISFQKQDYRITYDASCAIIIEVPLLVMYMDDSNGLAGDCIYRAFENLEQLAQNSDVPYALRDEIFAFAKTEINKDIYKDVSLEDNFLGLLTAAAYDGEKQAQVFATLDNLLSKSMDEFERKRLMDAKIELLHTAGRNNEAEILLMQNKDIWQYRELLVQRYLESRKYEEAKILAEEGLKGESKKQSWNRHADRWQLWLLRIGLLQKDIPAIRSYAKALFFKSFDHTYYNTYKQTFPAAEWEQEYNGWIKWFTNKGRIGITEMYALANIYISEHLIEKLLVLLQGNPDYEFAQYCKPYLQENFWPELLIVYRQALLEYAANAMNRSNYIELRKRMKELQKMNGGKDLVKELVPYFLNNYKQRRAMKEELEKINL